MITWAEEHLCIYNTPLRCTDLKIKYINPVYEIFENYFKFPKSRDFFMTIIFNIIIDAMFYFDASYLKKSRRNLRNQFLNMWKNMLSIGKINWALYPWSLGRTAQYLIGMANLGHKSICILIF